MGYIHLTSVTFVPAPATSQIVTVEYKLASSGTYTLFSNSLTVLSNGNFSPAQDITGLIDGETYDVRITPNCGGDPVVQQYVIPNATTTTTTVAPTTTTTTTVLVTTTTTTVVCIGFTLEATGGNATVTFVDCLGANQEITILNGNQTFICTLDGTYNVTVGSVNEVASGTCAL